MSHKDGTLKMETYTNRRIPASMTPLTSFNSNAISTASNRLLTIGSNIYALVSYN
jgi:hypothetical protein